MSQRPPTPRVLILTAAMGSGHLEVADELARRLKLRGAQCEVLELLSAAGAAGARLRATYRGLLRYAPGIYAGAMRVWARAPSVMTRLTSLGAGPFDAAVQAAVDRFAPDVVVSTYNLAAQCVGRLVPAGRLHAVTVTLVIDPGPHPYWIDPNVDLHLVPSDEWQRQVPRFGGRRSIVTAPVLRPEFERPPTRAQARSRLGLDPDARTVLVTAGSWAAGGVRRTVADAADAGLDLLVLCGHDTELAQQLDGLPRVRAVPWTRAVADHLAAADVVLDNAGGLTFLEAQACGTPVVLYRPLPGHGRLNVAALERAGAARVAGDAARLRALLRDPAAPVTGVPAGLPRAEDAVLELVADRAAARRR